MSRSSARRVNRRYRSARHANEPVVDTVRIDEISSDVARTIDAHSEGALTAATTGSRGINSRKPGGRRILALRRTTAATVSSTGDQQRKNEKTGSL
jgi:hypothetical protein